MKDEPKGPPEHGPPSQSPLNIDKVEKLVVIEHKRAPEIPEGKGRTCPQCRHMAWALSRFCWHCGYDFDRAELPRVHPRKLLLLALLIQAVVLVVILVSSINGIRLRNPTSDGSVVTPTSPFALAGTLHGITTWEFSVTGERKVDLKKVWGDVPSADVEETRKALKARAPAAPLVTVGTVQGNVITINSAAGLDLSALLARPQGSAS